MFISPIAYKNFKVIERNIPAYSKYLIPCLESMLASVEQDRAIMKKREYVFLGYQIVTSMKTYSIVNVNCFSN